MTETNFALKTDAPGPVSQPVLLLRNTKSNGDKVRRFPLQQFRLSIGRAADDDICLSEGSGVSRQHASVLVLDGEVVIEDLGSRNGTYVNRKLIRGSRQTTLKFGDVITIGRYRLKLVDEAKKADAGRAGDVQSLLAAWPSVPALTHADLCALCAAPRRARTVGGDAPINDASAEVTDTPIVISPTVSHGRLYGRKLPRRHVLKKRPVPGKRAGLVSAKRLASPVLFAANARGHFSSLH